MADNFINPVGSIEEDVYRKRRDYNDINFKPSLRDYDPEVDQYKLRGKGGKVRHQGDFSSNNPYLEQLMTVRNNKDLDALYERAVEWEADYANRQMQLQENRAILEEQRLYDSPEQQMLRMRQAGINPDLAGFDGSGSGSGGSAGMHIPDMADQSGQSKFQNAYDDKAQRRDGFKTAASFITSISSLVGTILNGVSTMKLLPSQKALNEANAGLMDAQANEIQTLLSGKKAGQSLSNQALTISNSTAQMEQLARMSELISPDTADMAPHLSALGIPAEHHAAYGDMIKAFHSNPAMKSKYFKDKLDSRWQEMENSKYTDTLISKLIEGDALIKETRMVSDQQFAEIEKNIGEILTQKGYAETVASSQMAEAQVSKEGNQLKLDKLRHNAKCWADHLVSKAEEYNRNEAEMQSIYGRCFKGGVVPKTEEERQKLRLRYLTPEEQGQIDALEAINKEIKATGSEDVARFYALKRHASSITLFNDIMFDEDGKLKSVEGYLQPYTIQKRWSFDDVTTDTKTAYDITNDVIGHVEKVGDIVVKGIGAAKIGAGLSTSKSTPTYTPTSKEDWMKNPNEFGLK